MRNTFAVFVTVFAKEYFYLSNHVGETLRSGHQNSAETATAILLSTIVFRLLRNNRFSQKKHIQALDAVGLMGEQCRWKDCNEHESVATLVGELGVYR